MSTISAILPTPPDGFSTQIASSSITTTSLSVELDDATDLPTEGVGQMFKKNAQGEVIAGTIEFCHWTNKSGNTLTFSDTGDRGITGSDSGAQAYVADDYFEVWVSKYYTPNDVLDNAFNPSTGAVDTTKVVTPSGTQTLTNKTFDDAQTIKGISAPTSPSAGYIKLYAGTDDKIYKKTSAGVVSELGAGGTAAETFIIPGTLATGTDLAKTWVLPFDCKLQSATPYVKTAGTTNATTFDINLNGSTIATTKLSIASGATSGSNQALDNPTTTRTAGSLITIDIDSASTTPPQEAYIVLFYERV